MPEQYLPAMGSRWFMPNGFGAVLSAMLITMFSFMGAEIVTIAAAESDTPDKHIVRAAILLSGEFPSFTCVPFLWWWR